MKKTLEPFPAILPMPALLVATFDADGTPNAMTAAWSAACCHSPPCVGVAVRSSRLTYDNMTSRKAFTLNIPGAASAEEVDYLGIVSGKKRPDKLAHAGLSTGSAGEVDAPIIHECPVNLECRLVNDLPLGSHTWFVGEVIRVHADEEIVSREGKIDVRALDPLAYCMSAGDYWKMGEPIGAAYDIGKKLKE